MTMNAQQVLDNCVWECGNDVQTAEQYYIDNAGTMETPSESKYTEPILDLLAESFTSPVQRVVTGDGDAYYGVIEYTEGDEWYGFMAYDDRSQSRRVVGVREDATNESDLPHATAGDKSGSFADDPDASYQKLASRLSEYYEEQYGSDRQPVDSVGPPDHANAKRPPNAGPPDNPGNSGNGNSGNGNSDN